MTKASDIKVAMSECLWWLEGALQCKDWVWDPDQREAAEAALEQAQKLLKEAP